MMESTRSLEKENPAALPADLPGAEAGRRAGMKVLWGAKELLTSKTFLFALAAFTLMMSGALLNSATMALFTSAQTVTTNNYAAMNINLGAPTFTAFNFSKIVPNDMMHRTISITNSGDSAPIYMTSFATGSTALNTNTTDGLRMILFRCLTAGDLAASCASATKFTEVAGVMGTPALSVTTGGNVPTAAGLSVTSNTSMTFTTGLGGITGSTQAIAGQPILTKNVSGTGTACATTPNDGGCLLGGLTTGLSNMATSIALTGGTADIPTGTSISGTANAATDNLLLYVFFPTNGTQATFGGLTSTLTFAFSAVQPAGTLNPSR